MPASTFEFRYAFLQAWRLQTTITTTAVLAVMFARAVLSGQPIERPDLLLNLFIAAACAVGIAVPVALTRFSVSADGLRTFNSLGIWSLVPWSAIAHVKPARFVFLPHLRLSVDGRRIRCWVPLFLNDMQGLRSAVEMHAGAQNPLFRALPLPPREASR